MEGRTVRCNVGDRILGEGTNQQIRVLNLNRRPNINSRPVSPTASATATVVAATAAPVSAPVCLPRVHGFLGLAHSFLIGFAIQPVPYLRLICGTAWRLSDIYERRFEEMKQQAATCRSCFWNQFQSGI